MAESPLETENMNKTPTPDTGACDSVSNDGVETVFDADAMPTDEVSALLEKLDAITEEANAHRDRTLRAVAEMENFRRRSIREKDEARKFANQSLLENFLPILDNFSMGLEQARNHEGGKAFAEGFAMILTQIQSWLAGHGVETINPMGEEFDANFHEAVAHVPHPDVPDHHIIEVTRVGYRLHDRLLRPAAVVISSGPPTAEASKES